MRPKPASEGHKLVHSQCLSQAWVNWRVGASRVFGINGYSPHWEIKPQLKVLIFHKLSLCPSVKLKHTLSFYFCVGLYLLFGVGIAIYVFTWLTSAAGLHACLVLSLLPTLLLDCVHLALHISLC